MAVNASNLPVVFNFGTQSIRTIDKDGEVWFVANDVCAVLEIANPRSAVARLDDDERDAVVLNDAMGRPQEVTVINESGLFSLVLSSRKAEAKQFKRWVTHDVLPAIRKTGKYEAAAAPQALEPTQAPLPMLPPPRRIRSYKDLSFVKRDADGKLLSWFMPSRDNNWHEHYGLGETWFEEIVELAQHDPKEAFNAMHYAAKTALMRYGEYGHSDGFFDRMSRWALHAILTNDQTPKMPFKTLEMGIPPREGMDYWLAREGKGEQRDDALDRQALIDSADCILECLRKARSAIIENRK